MKFRIGRNNNLGSALYKKMGYSAGVVLMLSAVERSEKQMGVGDGEPDQLVLVEDVLLMGVDGSGCGLASAGQPVVKQIGHMKKRRKIGRKGSTQVSGRLSSLAGPGERNKSKSGHGGQSVSPKRNWFDDRCRQFL